MADDRPSYYVMWFGRVEERKPSRPELFNYKVAFPVGEELTGKAYLVTPDGAREFRLGYWINNGNGEEVLEEPEPLPETGVLVIYRTLCQWTLAQEFEHDESVVYVW